MPKKKKVNRDNYITKKQRCYICGGDMERKEIIYENIKWGGGQKYPENVIANVCTNPNCGERTFSTYEAQRLQELSRQY